MLKPTACLLVLLVVGVEELLLKLVVRLLRSLSELLDLDRLEVMIQVKSFGRKVDMVVVVPIRIKHFAINVHLLFFIARGVETLHQFIDVLKLNLGRLTGELSLFEFNLTLRHPRQLEFELPSLQL